MNRKCMRWALLFIYAAAVLFCSCTQVSQESVVPEIPAEVESPWKIIFVCNDLKHPWNACLLASMEAKCVQMGLSFAAVDCAGRNDLYLRAIGQLDQQGSEKIALVTTPTSQSIGPIITGQLADMDIPAVFLNSRIKTTEGGTAPLVGIPAYESGRSLGRTLIQTAKEKGFLEDDKVKIVLMTNSNLYFENKLIQGIRDVLTDAFPSLGNDHYALIESIDASFAMQYASLKQHFVALDPDAKYICSFFNDDGAYAFFRFALEEGADLENIIVSAAGGYEPSYDIFSKGLGTNYYVVCTDAKAMGEKAIDLLYARCMQGLSPIPDITYLGTETINEKNFARYFSHMEKSICTKTLQAYYGWSIPSATDTPH